MEGISNPSLFSFWVNFFFWIPPKHSHRPINVFPFWLVYLVAGSLHFKLVSCDNDVELCPDELQEDPQKAEEDPAQHVQDRGADCADTICRRRKPSTVGPLWTYPAADMMRWPPPPAHADQESLCSRTAQLYHDEMLNCLLQFNLIKSQVD